MATMMKCAIVLEQTLIIFETKKYIKNTMKTLLKLSTEKCLPFCWAFISLGNKSCHNANLVVTGVTVVCHNNSLRCHQWQQIWHSHDDVIKWKHIPRYWPFVRGIHRSPVNSPHKGQWRKALMFSWCFFSAYEYCLCNSFGAHKPNQVLCPLCCMNCLLPSAECWMNCYTVLCRIMHLFL